MHLIRYLLVSALPCLALFLFLSLPSFAFYGSLLFLFFASLRKGPGQAATPAAVQEPLTPDLAKKVVTYFYPGLGGSWMQALRYVGKDGLWGKAGEPRIANAPRLLYTVKAINPPEVIELRAYALYLAPLALPWWSTALITSIGTAYHGIENRIKYAIDVPFVSFAQRGDTDTFLESFRVEKWDSSLPRRILAGSSRGASTVLCAVTLMTPEEQAALAFVLLEGAFDTVPAVARARFGPWLGPLVTALLPWLTSYDAAHPTPLDMARAFPARVPVAFVTSKADTVVPMAHTLALRDAVVAARGGDATHVHTLVLEKSGHSTYVNEDLEDQARYRAFVDGLYRQYVLN